ncbi:tRNA-uridine aminocarboxypropyltransferase 1 [Periophthalmus magnuspinnatus]|uniref:tRNA-uridine aminocarboxypropyltransferase 1 n=1 Tax=Periophthalmus magnuspinnatus TaxID=409849 RepID=UPI00145B1B43|nr:tRNA-uridine aminocarboxypropyltransferase 1 [Periophthalmus magnuspinnatus]
MWRKPCCVYVSSSYERLVFLTPTFGLSKFFKKVHSKKRGRISMSVLDQDQSFHPGCHDKTTLSANSTDMAGSAKQPLQSLKLASHEVLEQAQQKGRLKCAKCGGSRMFFCYTCCSLVGVGPQDVPRVKLPVKIDIIKHPNETDGKSTAIHAKILAPDDVNIYTYPCIPEYDQDKVVLVFPGPKAVTVQNMIQSLTERAQDPSEPRRKRFRGSSLSDCPTHGEGERGEEGAEGKESKAPPIQKVVFIDSTWNQTNKISTDERLQDLLQVELKTRKTCFWRHQKGKPDTYLSTIEAIYYFLKDFHELCLERVYTGEYDNVLFFYSYLHTVINKAKTAAGRK